MFKNKNVYLILGGFILLIIIGIFYIPGYFLPNRSQLGRISPESQPSVTRSDFGLIAEQKIAPENEPVPVKPEKTQILKIIKTGEIKYRVLHYRQSRANIEKILKSFQAYIASENEQNLYESIENTIRIRVSAVKFDQLVEALMNESNSLDYKNIQAQDVTAEFIDNEARLKAKREVEQRYLAILKQANNVKDILEVENQLGQIREAIEATQGQLKYLNDQVNYSTITLIFYQNLHRLPQTENGFWYRTGEAFVNGWNALLSVLIGLIYLWPFLIIIGGGIWVYIKFFHQKRNLSA